MRAIGTLVILGLPGLLIGSLIGVAVRRWVLLLVIAGLGVAAFAYGINHVSEGPDDDGPRVLVALAAITNFVGWLVGLTLGFVLRRSFHRGAETKSSSA
jgi:hypothetical protein